MRSVLWNLTRVFHPQAVSPIQPKALACHWTIHREAWVLDVSDEDAVLLALGFLARCGSLDASPKLPVQLPVAAGEWRGGWEPPLQ